MKNQIKIAIVDANSLSFENVLHQLLTYRQGKTTILISHRPRVINRADSIVLLERGKLQLQGSLDYICSKSGEHLLFLTP